MTRDKEVGRLPRSFPRLVEHRVTLHFSCNGNRRRGDEARSFSIEPFVFPRRDLIEPRTRVSRKLIRGRFTPPCRYARMFAGFTSARAFSVLLHLVLLPVSPLPPYAGLGNVGLACLYFLQSTFHVRRARNRSSPAVSEEISSRSREAFFSRPGAVIGIPVRAEVSRNDLVRPARVQSRSSSEEGSRLVAKTRGSGRFAPRR